MFARRRHIAPPAPVVEAAPVQYSIPAPAPQLDAEQITEIVRRQLETVFGERGSWTVTARRDGETDSIFRAVLTHSIAVGVTAAIQQAQDAAAAPVAIAPVADAAALAREIELKLSAEPASAQPADVAADADDDELTGEPAALGWEPAPITVWTDLKKPVTGPLAQVA
jgi:hypothetical protein